MSAIHPIISERKSTVLFNPKEIDKEVIDRLFEAARWAASSLNQQPWQFVYALRGDSNYTPILNLLNVNNQEWAKNAPMLMVTIAQVISDYKGRENIYAWHDTGMAYSNLVFQAVHEGLSLHPMGGFDRNKLSELLGIKPGFEIVACAAIGYKADSTDFPKHLVDREKGARKRKELSEFVFRNTYRK